MTLLDDIITRLRSSVPQIAFLLMLAILLLAAGTRFHLLGAQSLWHDEGNSYVQATRSFGDIATHAGRDIHPPGYYWLLALWRGFTGETEFALRSLSAFASILTVALTYALGVRLFGRLSGLTAALFVAMNTFSIYYAQEARMYALLALWGAASMWAFVGFMRSPVRLGVRPGAVLVLALFNVAGLWTQYAFSFVMLTQGVLFVLWLTDAVRRLRGDGENLNPVIQQTGYYIAANLLTIALYLPWIPTAWQQISIWPSTGQSVAFSEAASTLLGYFAFGITVGGGTTVAVAFFLLFALLNLPDEQPPASVRLPVWWRILVPVLWVFITLGVFLLLELFREANLKLLLPAQIAFALWLGRGIRVLSMVRVHRTSRLLRAVPRLAAVLGTFAMLTTLWGGLPALYDDPAYQRDDYRAIAAFIQANAQPDGAVILSAPNQEEVFDYYYSGAAPVFPLPRGLGGDDAATLNETRAIISDYERIYAVLWGVDERDPAHIVENTLAAEAFEVDSTWYGDVRLVRYVTPVDFDTLQESGAQFGEAITLERYGISADEVQPGDVLQIRLEWSIAERLEMRYKVFVQLLNPDGTLAAQRDAEPGGGRLPTTMWQPSETITDNHALIVPNDLPPTHYLLIVGLYNPDNPQERLFIAGKDYLELGEIVIQPAS